VTGTDWDWARRSELTDLLRACRARVRRPVNPGGRHGGLRQEDAADLSGLSLRRYGALERGEFTPTPGIADQVAAALRMADAERSALHVLATGQDPPRLADHTAAVRPGGVSSALRDLIDGMAYPAALTDETWTMLHYNKAMNAWSGGWYDDADRADRHVILYLFSALAEDRLPDVHAIRRAGMAALRYQYTRNLATPEFAPLITRLTAASPEAAALWKLHEVAFPAHEYPVRLRHAGPGVADAQALCLPVSPRLWLHTAVLPPNIQPLPF